MEVRYEVYVTREGREFLEGSAEAEDHACNMARILLQKHRAEAARVVQIKRGWTGREYEKEVYAVQAPKSEAPVNVAGMVDQAPLCETADDLFALNGRVTISQVLRRYLDHHGITALELLHNHREQRRVQDAGSLMLGAVGRVATAQMERHGGELRARTDHLQALIDQVHNQARTCDVRGAPRLDRGDFIALVDRLPGRAGDPDRRYLARLAISHALLEMRQIAGKLEILLAWFGGDLPEEVVGLLDGFVADTLMSGRVVMELLGKRANLAEAMEALIAISRGQFDASDPSLEPMTGQLNAVLGRYPLPETVATLLDRVRRELAGTQSLTKGDDQAEQAAFRRLVVLLTTPEGPVGGPDMAAGLLRRFARVTNKVGPTAIPAAIQEVGSCFSGTWEEMNFLMALLRSELGGDNVAPLMGALLKCLDEVSSIDQFMWSVRDPSEKVSRVAGFHDKFANLALPPAEKKKIAQWLEKMVVELQTSSARRKQ